MVHIDYARLDSYCMIRFDVNGHLFLQSTWTDHFLFLMYSTCLCYHCRRIVSIFLLFLLFWKWNCVLGNWNSNFANCYLIHMYPWLVHIIGHHGHTGWFGTMMSSMTIQPFALNSAIINCLPSFSITQYIWNEISKIWWKKMNKKKMWFWWQSEWQKERSHSKLTEEDERIKRKEII